MVAAGFRQERFSEAGLLGHVLSESLMATAAILFLRSRGYDVKSLLPTPTLHGSAAGIGLFVAAWIAASLAVMPFAAHPQEQPVERMFAGAQIGLTTLVSASICNGLYEEVFLLGVLVRGLRGYGLSICLGVASLIRVLYHTYQGPLGAVSVLVVGLVFSVYYVRRGQLWPPVFAHALLDVVGVLIRQP